MEPVSLTVISQPDSSRSEPLAVQLYRDLLAAILDQRLSGLLPSSRTAAQTLGLSRNTVNAAYDLLRAEGAVTIAPGTPPRIVRPERPAPRTANEPTGLPALTTRGHSWAATPEARSAGGIMAPGHPDEGLFPRDEWALLLRRAARATQGEAFAYAHYSGLPDLCTILARRLGADRGMLVSPDQILITPGSQAALCLAALTLSNPGDTALIEDPGYGGARAAFLGAGLSLSLLPVDGEGADPAHAPPACLIYLTPANHYPLGHRLSLPRRAAIIAHARRHQALIIEDDYDSEFLWQGRAIAALQPSAPDQILTIGTAAKALMPALRLGWMVVPAHLAPALKAAQRNLGMGANLHAQRALAAMMEQGRYRAHLHKIARTYGERGRALATAVRALPGVQVNDPSGGVQLSIRLPPGTETAAIAALNGAGFGTAPLSAYCLGPSQEGLVTGFAEATPQRIARFTKILSKALGTRAQDKA